MMRIALDAMGGDNAPGEIVKGGVEAATKLKDVKVLLVGDSKRIKEELAKYPKAPYNTLEVVDAPDEVSMDESPVAAVRRKKNCSINVCMRLVKNGDADAMVSAGNSGAVASSAVFTLGRIPGVLRPAIATVLPTRQPRRPLLLLDAGANMDCHEEWLVQFAIMGSAYSRTVLHRTAPLVGLLSIGTEDCKGNEMTKRTFPLLKNLKGIDFRGNVEGHDIFMGQTDVVVCDGFVGNVVLKTSESVAHAVGYWLKKELFRYPSRILGALLLKGALHALKNRLDPENYGGAALLGVPGAVIITHGASSHRAIFYAVNAAENAARNKVTALIAARIGEYEASKKSEVSAKKAPEDSDPPPAAG